MSILGISLLVIVIAATSAILTKAATHLRVLDVPNHRSSHTSPVPRLGGLAILIASGLGLLGAQSVGLDVSLGHPGGMTLIAACVVVAAVGLGDDIWQWPVWTKFTGQLVGTAILLGSGVVVQRLSIPWVGEIDLGIAGYIVSAIWLLGLTNAFNFMDGLNGIAGGTAAIAAFAFGIFALDQGASGVAVIALVLAAAILGFLPFNFPRARIFMGDVGSQFLGFALAGLAILGARPDEPRVSFLVMPILFLVFIWDVTFTFGRRLSSGEPVWLSHRTHLYQLLSRSLGSGHVRVSLLHYAMAMVQAVAAWFLVEGSAFHAALALGCMILLVGLYTIVVLLRAKMKGVKIRSDIPSDHIAKS